jgi:hypothetical protein
MSHDFSAEAAFLKVVLSGGSSVTTRIDRTRAAAVDAVAHVNADTGDEIILEVARISSGATGVAYGLHDGRLVPAGTDLFYNGDSGAQAGFNCLPGNPPRLIQRTFVFVGPAEFTRSWKETEAVYAWHGPKLRLLSRHKLGQRVAITGGETHVGMGCLRGAS